MYREIEIFHISHPTVSFFLLCLGVENIVMMQIKYKALEHVAKGNHQLHVAGHYRLRQSPSYKIYSRVHIRFKQIHQLNSLFRVKRFHLLRNPIHHLLMWAKHPIYPRFHIRSPSQVFIQISLQISRSRKPL